jgi:hypothetical protein
VTYVRDEAGASDWAADPIPDFQRDDG